MPRFRYTATNEKGKTVRGLLEAPSEEALYAKLRNDGLYMTDAQEAQKAHATFRPLKTAVLADFCRNLGTLLTAGVPLVRAFRIMADERTIDARQKALYEAILSELRKGVPLSDAMESCAPAFPTLLLAMIRSAEGTGSIDHACARMATYYEREHKMNQQVGNSMMYPIILSVLIVGVIAILMTFVLPQFKPMFDQMETLPFLTQLLFDVSDFVGANWPVLLVVAALIVFGGKLLLAQPKVRRQWDRFILHAPVVGVLNRKICTARFASTLSNLYGSGVPIITTLAAARDAIGNRWIESQFGDALDSIRAGHSLSEAIAGIDGFEVKLSSSVAVGEETGKLDSLLATISETLDYEAEMATKRLVTLLEPVMIVVMGLVVGGIVAAVIVPIYQSYGTIGASSGAIYILFREAHHGTSYLFISVQPHGVCRRRHAHGQRGARCRRRPDRAARWLPDQRRHHKRGGPDRRAQRVFHRQQAADEPRGADCRRQPVHAPHPDAARHEREKADGCALP